MKYQQVASYICEFFVKNQSIIVLGIKGEMIGNLMAECSISTRNSAASKVIL